MLWGLAAVASGLACSSDPDSVVVVTVTAPHGLPPVFQLRATATLAGSVDSVLFPEKAASTAIDFAPAATFGLTVPRSRAGSLQIAVDALDASAVAVARGTGSVAIAAGGRADVVIPLGLVTWGLDGGSGTDSGGPADLDGGLARDALDVATALDALVADGPMVVLDGASLEVAWLDVAPTWPDAGTPDVPIGGGGGAGGNGGAGGSASGGAGAGGASSRGGSSGTAGSTSTGGIQGTGGLTVAGGRTGTGGSSTSDAGSDQDASPCPGGQILCDGSCTDVQADNANCGACGRACTAATPSTAKCTVGRCLVTLDTEVLTSGSCRALDATRAYYMSSTSDILSIPLAGGTRTTLLARQSSCRGFALDQTGLYWTNVSDGTTDPNSGSVKKIPLQGGAVTTLASGLYSPESLAVDTGAVYWISYSGGTVLSMPLGGGTITTLASDLIYPTNLRIDARYVYWFGKGQAGTVQRAPLAGGGATVLASEQESTMDIVVDASYVYWSRRGYPGRILKLPLDGSSATPVTVMTMGQYEHPDNLAVDDAYLYWTVYNPSTENGSIVKMPLAGGAPVVLVSGQRSPVGLMVDATSLYWVNGMAPNKPLMRLTPK